MELSAVVLLAIGISLDGLAAGIAYGMRQVRMPIMSLGIASCVSGAAVLLAMQAGALVSQYVDSGFVPRLGAALLIGLGLWSILQSRGVQGQSLEMPKASSEEEDVILRLRLQPFGLVIQVWKEPLAADVDASGIISSWEAALLGTALALDAVGVGLAAALAGFPLVSTCVSVSVVSFLALSSGLLLGSRWAGCSKIPAAMLSRLPGIVLIAIGFWWIYLGGR
ncbi:MAG: sporulation membrane protein YtaF [Firmicutes bacterium]|nr:sporulation membrane protein YtaF [Bacillota bacterium]